MAAKTKSTADYAKDYTDPQLRMDLKEKIKAESKGGKSGQWSARKSQLLTKEYEAAGGGYKHQNQLTSAQRNLKKWTKEEWQTEHGEKAIKKDGETDRYLPRDVWNKLSPSEKKAAHQSKKQGSRHGQQYVANPDSVKSKKD
ncbi:hypothetical protein [Candidatus Odyssella thessalonicensis]|uniref:hypothetical protein n=1 Tax=Candidatus Odyssella thessalonicensis TaxID=84647 RepID=UPI000225B176|nr:hypothetical protein [Candidatus Odyssella thessalonicensis]